MAFRPHRVVKGLPQLARLHSMLHVRTIHMQRGTRFAQNLRFKLSQNIRIIIFSQQWIISMRSHLQIAIILGSLIISGLGLYCSSTCVDYTGACYDDTPQGCYACANHIYGLAANMTAAVPCTTLPQTSVIANDLANTGMTLSGFTSSQAATKTCTNYTFSG